MATKTKRSTSVQLKTMAAAIALIGTSAAGAQEATNLPDPRVQMQSCEDVDWASDLLTRYPRIAEGCHEVVVANGSKWARFEADFKQRNIDGSVTANVKDRRGRSMGDLTLMPATGQHALIDGQKVRFADLNRGQSLNMYIPEHMFAVATEPGVPPTQLAQIVVEPVQLAQVTNELPQQQQISPQPRQTLPQQLPSTAGPLPWLLLLGQASLLSGLGLSLRRKFFNQGN